MDDFVPARASLLATLEAGLVLTFLDGFGDACFFTNFDMVMFPVVEPKIDLPSPKARDYGQSSIRSLNIGPRLRGQYQCFHCGRSPVRSLVWLVVCVVVIWDVAIEPFDRISLLTRTTAIRNCNAINPTALAKPQRLE